VTGAAEPATAARRRRLDLARHDDAAASTPYPDVLYVAKLIGPDVINTMPEQTLRAFADHGIVAHTLDADPLQPDQTLADAAAAGIDLTAITADLEREGVQSFCDSYREVLECIAGKLDALPAVAR
jgi:transaldolase